MYELFYIMVLTPSNSNYPIFQKSVKCLAGLLSGGIKMALDRNQEIFDTYMHRRVWGQGTQLIPIEKTLPYVDEEYKNSCIDLHNFYSAVFEDMYENIALYGLLPNGISELTYEATILKRKQNSLIGFFMGLAKYSEIDENGNMVLATANYIKHFKKNSVIQELLSNHGLVISSFPAVTVVSNTKYPDMFRIIHFICNSKNKYNIMSCDYI